MKTDAEKLVSGAIALSSSAILAQLLALLVRKGLLDDREVREMYESALLTLEHAQGGGEGGAFIAAREIIESRLRSQK